MRDKSFSKMTDNEWDLVHDVHLMGAFKITKAAWRHFVRQGFGRIIMTISAAGLYGNVGQTNYSSGIFLINHSKNGIIWIWEDFSY